MKKCTMIEADWDSVLEDYANSLSQFATKTQRFHKCQIRQLQKWAMVKNVELHSMSAKLFREYIAERQKTKSENTVWHDVQVARQFFSFCEAEKYAPGRILAGYRSSKPPQAEIYLPTQDDLKRLIAGIGNFWKCKKASKGMSDARCDYLSARDVAIVCLLIETGCRLGEALKLQIEDINLAERKVTLKNRKNRQTDTLIMSTAIDQPFARWMKIRKKIQDDCLRDVQAGREMRADNSFFLTVFGEQITVNLFSSRFREYKNRAGIPARLTPHCLRHYTLTQIANYDIRAAQLQAGHKSIQTTAKTYAHPDMESVAKVHQKAAPLGQLVSPLKKIRRSLV